ncbi:MAG TPA: hypothetical protein VMV20_03365 [Chitinophagaceae bacterium]|nr:hypothetical protein [Chitinophagaceae bacterium]
MASPFSQFGIGDIDYRDYGRTDGIGSTGIALTSPKYMNNLNPASYSSIETKAFLFEMSLREKTLSYRDQSNPSHSGSDLNFEKVAFGFRVAPFWTTGLGIKPFSTVDYQVATLKNVSGSNDQFRSTATGNGGVTNLYWTNAFNIGKHLAIGISSSYLFGSINQNEALLGTSTQDSLTVQQTSFLRGAYFQGGLLYLGRLGSHYKLGLGVVYNAKTPLRIDNNTYVEGGGGDTLKGFTNLVGFFELPQYYGAGISLTHNDRFTLAADYKYYRWSDLNVVTPFYSLVNASRFSLGGEYSYFQPNSGDYFEKYFLQAGLFYENSYLQVNGQQLQSYGLTLGTGLPNKSNSIYFNIGMEVGRRGTISNGLIQENYFMLKLNIVVRTPWFIRSKNF